MQILRYTFAVAAALFVLAIAVQVFLAGMFLFADGSRETHVEFGYTIALAPLILVLLAGVARVGWRLFGLTVGLLALTWLQASLPALGELASWVAALHPVNALFVFGLSVLVTRRAYALARRGTAHQEIAAERVAAGVPGAS